MTINLVFGLIWLGYGTLSILTDANPNWIDYGWLVIAGLYLIVYFYQRSRKYITIDNGILQIQGLFGKKINLNEVQHIRKFAGDYILKTGESQLTINTQIIDEESLTELNGALQKLDVTWT